MQCVILAAGESSRFWPLNKQHKSLIKIMGKPLILHTIEILRNKKIKDIVIVRGVNKDIEKELAEYAVKLKYVVQPKLKGTGDAVSKTEKLIKENFLVVGPHKVDLDDYISVILNKFKKNKEKIILVGTKTATPWDFGIFDIKNGKIIKIIENPPRGKEPSLIKSSETYLFPKDFFKYYKKTSSKEDNLIDTINLLIKERGAELVLLKKEPVSLKYPWHLFYFLRLILEKKIIRRHVSSSAKIGKNVVINGNVFIADNVKIREGTVINGPCYIGKNCEIGANNVLRGPVNIENNVKTGAFFEIKNSIIEENTTFHSGYIGDSIIGKNCNFGADFITANLRLNRNTVSAMVKGKKIDTGLKKLGVVVGNNSRFGIKCGTMPGIFIGSSCVIGPSTTVFENIGDNTKYFAEFKNTKKKLIK